MNHISVQKYSPAKQLLITILTVFVSFLLCMFAGNILLLLCFDINLMTDASVLDATSNNANINALKLLQTVYSLGLFVVPAFIAAYFISGKIGHYLYLNRLPKVNLLVLTFFIILFALPLLNLLGVWNAEMQLPDFLSGLETWMRQSEEQAKIVTEKFLNVHTIPALGINLLVIAVIPALGEELLFRGIIQQIFTRIINKHWAILLTAFLFSALHIQFFGFVPRMMMGVLFGYLLVWSKNLWIPIIAHLINNGMAVIVAYMINNETISKDVENIGADKGTIIFSLITTVFLTLLLIRFFRISKRQS